MLEGLDDIDWASIDHGYGSATDLPDLVRGLLSPDKHEREEAFFELSNCICHQDTVYAGTAVVVPFLYELLTSPEVQLKPWIAVLLAGLADGNGEEAHVLAARKAVGVSLPLLVTQLQAQEDFIRWQIANALQHYPDQAHAWLPALEAALANETDDSAREEMQKRKDEVR